jgi:hypothetical protein
MARRVDASKKADPVVKLTSREEAEAKIKWLARQCANSGLRRHHARSILDALWMADLVRNHGGNIVRACEASGVNRRQFYRLTREENTDDDPE